MEHRLTTRFLFVSLLLLVPVFAAAEEDREMGAVTYGEGVTLSESTPISEIHAHPGKYVGKVVRVEGRIVDACQKRGCWMELAGDRDFQSVRVKVDDGVIVFPADCPGRWGIAEGELQRIELTLEQTRKMAQHQCEEEGTEKTFDPQSITEPAVIYQVHATGAVIEDRPAGEKENG